MITTSSAQPAAGFAQPPRKAAGSAAGFAPPPRKAAGPAAGSEAVSPPPPIKSTVSVYSMGGEKYADLDLGQCKEITVGALKLRIQEQNDLPINKQQLVLGGEPLYCDDHLLSTIGGITLILYIHPEDVAECITAVKQNGSALEYASEELRGHRAVVMEAVKQSGSALEYASDELRGDSAVVMAAVLQGSCWCLEYASAELRGDRGVVMAAVKKSGFALRHASDALRGDSAVVMEAVQQDGEALRYASDELKADKEVVLEAVKQNGSALRYASDDLKNDKAVVLAAVKQNGIALEYASEELRRDKDMHPRVRYVHANSTHSQLPVAPAN